MASTSTSAGVYPPTKSCFEVFLNHRGPDTKDEFASPLYHKLDVLHDIRVFLDKDELQVGDSITSQIQEAIKAASVHVAIFSPRYAESVWCLDELHLMVESGKPIIPVFYNVQPTELRWTYGDKGVYARALQNLEKKKKQDGQPRYNPATVQNWRTTLFTVADISGLELKTFNGDKEKLLDEVVKSVLKKLNKTCFDVAEHPIGLDEKIKKFEDFLLQQQSSKPKVIGIVGMGGIGKTTFVEELFNKKSSRYNKSCFLPDVRENARKSSLKSLQKKLLNSFTKWPDVELESVDEGRKKLRTHAESCEALVILDDVDSANQLDALLSPIRDVLGRQSLILITSRDKAVLRKSRVQDTSIYILDGLNPQHSKELFCLNAFNQRHPLPGFEDLVTKYLKTCDGLPLSLKVLGALGYENDRSFWEVQLKRIQQVLPEEIFSILQISYDTLQRDEKQMFLDIACFFIGKEKETTIRIWQGFGWEGSLAGFQSLQNKNLVQVDIKNEIRMHDHLRDLGRDLAKDPSLPRRIWGREDIDLLQQSPGITAVRGISLGWRECLDLSFSGCKMKDLRFLDIHSTKDFLESILKEVQSPNLIWLRWNSAGFSSSLPSSIPMKKLRVLQVSDVRLETLWQEESQAPLQLRELQIHALEMLTDSFGNLINLQHINFSVCSMIERLPDSFGNLINLQHLDLSRCDRLKGLPDSFRNLINLQHLDLSRCHMLEGLPDSFGNLINLQHLDLSTCLRLKGLPDSFGNLINLQHINLSTCCMLERLPDSFGNLKNLQHLNLSSDSSMLKRLPDTFGNLINLQHLNLSGDPDNAIHVLGNKNGLESLSDSFGNLRRLKYLNLRGCLNLSMSSETLGSISTLEYLYLSCGMEVEGMVEEVLPPQVAHQRSIGPLEYQYLSCGMEVEGMVEEVLQGMVEEVLPPQVAHQRSMKELTLIIPSLTGLPSDIGELRNLKKLELLECYKLKCLPDSLGRLNQLTTLNIRSCDNLVEIGTLPDALIELEVSFCPNLKCWPDSIGRLNQLTTLRCVGLFVEIGTLPIALVNLRWAWCPVEELPSMETLVSLEVLNTVACGKLRSIRGLARLTKLREIDVKGCSELKELVGVEHVSSLEVLYIWGCPNLQLGEGVDPKIINVF